MRRRAQVLVATAVLVVVSMRLLKLLLVVEVVGVAARCRDIRFVVKAVAPLSGKPALVLDEVVLLRLIT